MKGYYKNQSATDEVIKEGWFSTGDIGELSADGYLSITDRKKDIIVTSGGKNISPQNIEGLILSDSLFQQAVVLGDKRNYIVALLVPNRTEIQNLADERRIHYPSYEDLLQSQELYQVVEERLQKRLQPLPSYEQIKYFQLLEKEFTLENGELTPTQKIKRRVIMSKYADTIEKLYQKGSEWQRRQEAQGFSKHV